MRLKNFKIWGVFIVAIIVIAFLLFQQSNNNKKELEGQAIRNMELVAQNFKVYYDSHIANILQGRRKELLDSNITNFDSVKVKNVTLTNRIDNKPFLAIEIDKGIIRRIDFDQLFSKINRQEFFGQILLSIDSGKVIYPISEFGKSLGDYRTRTWETVHLPINKEAIVHDNQDYLHYYTLVDIANNQFYISGLIKNSYFESIGKRVDFANLTILVFLLAMMLFSLPIIAFFGLSKGDKVTRFGVYSIGLSLVGIMVLTGFGFAFFQNHHPVEHETHEKTMHEIRSDLECYIQEKSNILNRWYAYREGKYNDLVSIHPNGSVDTIYINGFLQEDQIFRSLSHRQYYRHFLKNQSAADFDANKIGKYYIGSHYSLDSSKLESVISTLDTDDRVKIITFNWGKNLTEFDEKRGFLIFKEDGLILHTSPKVKIIADSLSQLLSTVKWNEVSGIIASNKGNASGHEWEIPLYLDGHAFNATLIPVNGGEFDKTVWMIYLQDEYLEHVYSSLVTFESMFFLILYLIVLALISLANKLNKSNSTITPIKKFAYDYLFPKPALERNFVILIRFLSCYVFIILYFYHLKDIDFFAMFLVLMISTFHIKVLMFIWLRPIPSVEGLDPKEYGRKVRKAKASLHIFIWIMGAAIFVALTFLWQFVHPIQFFILMLWILISSVFSYRSRLKSAPKTLPIKKADQVSFRYLYFSFLVMWMFMVGFIPGYVIHSKIHRYERNNWEPIKENSPSLEPSDFWIAYDERRRTLFNNLTSLDDPQIREFVFPNRKMIQPDHSKAALNISFFEMYWAKFSLFPWSFLRISLLLVLTIGFFWWLIKKLAHQIYLLDYSFFLYGNNENFGNSTPLSNKIFLCGIDSNLYLPWIKEKYEAEEDRILVTDCTSNTNLTWGQNDIPDLKNKSIWLLNNIHCLPDHGILVNKLPFFIEATAGKVRLILCSGLSWKELFKYNQSNKSQVIYSQIFSDFHFGYVPISLPVGLDRELNSEEESSVLIRSMKAYFLNIWEELSFEEKKVCYYFSKEGFFNYSDKPVITELIQKGILVRTNRDELPKLFHRVFRQFILENITDEEKEEFRNDERKNGNAGSIQLAVFSFILLSVAMISYFDKNFLDQASTFVTAIAGTLGGIYSLFSRALPGTNAKSND